MHSHSATSGFNNCPWKHRLKQLGYAAQVVGVESNKAEWGKAMHAGLQVLHTGGDLAEAALAFDFAYPLDLDPSKPEWTLESGRCTLEAYVKRWDDGEWETLESEFHNPEDERDDTGHLVLDLVRRHKPSGSIYFWDHKIKTRWDGGASYELDAQLSRYTAYVRDKWGECAGCYVNVIVPAYRSRKWKDRPAGFDPQFYRVSYNRTPEQVEAWRKNQYEWEFVINECNEAETWPHHYGSLCGYCEFKDGCVAEANGEGMEGFERMYRPGAPAPLSDVTVEVED